MATLQNKLKKKQKQKKSEKRNIKIKQFYAFLDGGAPGHKNLYKSTATSRYNPKHIRAGLTLASFRRVVGTSTA